MISIVGKTCYHRALEEHHVKASIEKDESMRFILLDRVLELESGKNITAVKAVSLAEEYLADHFPAFPVLPGVMMLEALVQTAATLVRVTNNFEQSMVILHEAKNVKYKSFVKPGNLLTLKIEAKSIYNDSSTFKASAFVDERPMIEARLKLKHYNLADKDSTLAKNDIQIIDAMKNNARLVGAIT